MIPPAELWKVPVISKTLMILAAILGLNLYAQQPNAIQAPASGNGTAQAAQPTLDQQPDSEDDGDMQLWLNKSGKDFDPLVSLGVERSIAESFISAIEDDESVWARWQTVRAGPRQRFGILFLPCHSGGDTAYLYALARQEKVWHVTDQIQLDCHYDDNVSFEITWIRDPNRDEVLVHHACAGHGGGYLEQDFSVFAVSDGNLKEELSTEDVLRVAPPGAPSHDYDRTSTFALIPIHNSHLRAIEQTRSGLSTGKWIVQRRIFRWNPAKGKYVPSAFTRVEAPPN